MLLLGSGCSSTAVNNPAPKPFYFSCATLCELKGKNISRTAVNDLMACTAVNLKLREAAEDTVDLGCVCR
jgi:hypothetical protein